MYFITKEVVISFWLVKPWVNACLVGNMNGYTMIKVENMQVYLFISTGYVQSSISLYFTLPNLCCQSVWNPPGRLDKMFPFLLPLSLPCLEQ